MMRIEWVVCAIGLALGGNIHTARSQEGAGEKQDSSSSAPLWLPARPLLPTEEAIEVALKNPFTAEFVETPLTEVAEYISAKCKVQVHLDTRALDGVGITSDTPITFQSGGVSLRSALRLMLKEVELSYLIDSESLVITTPDVTTEIPETRIYNVCDLVTAQEWPIADGPDEFDFQTLEDMITSTIAPESWDEVGGAGSLVGNVIGGRRVLVVSQTRFVQEQIEGLLTQIRKVKAVDSEQAQVSVYRLTAEATDKGDELVRLIKQVIDSDSWSRDDCIISVAAGVIVVKHSPQVQDQVRKLLRAMHVLEPSINYFPGTSVIPVVGSKSGSAR